MSNPIDALSRVREALAGEHRRNRVTACALDDLESLICQLEAACVKHVAAARDHATLVERDRCGRIAADLGAYAAERVIRGGQ